MNDPRAPLGSPSPTTPLYSPWQVALAAILGSPAAGGWVLFRNFRRLGDHRALSALLLGLGITAALLALGALLPEAASRALPVAGAVALWQVARAWQGERFEAHVRAGGPRQPTWRAVVVGLVFLLVVMLGVASVVATGVGQPPSVRFGESAVLYEEGATLRDARRVGGVLRGVLLASGSGMEVRLRRQPGLVVSFALLDRKWEDPVMVGAYEELQAELGTVLDEPVTLELTDEGLETRRTLRPR